MGLFGQGDKGSGKKLRQTKRRRTQTTASGNAKQSARQRGNKTSGGNGDIPKQR